MGNCSPSPRRDRPSPAASPTPHRTTSGTASGGGGGNSATTVSLYTLARSPSVSFSLDPDAEAAEESNIVRVYGSDAFLYKAAAPLHFTPSETAPLGRPPRPGAAARAHC